MSKGYLAYQGAMGWTFNLPHVIVGHDDEPTYLRLPNGERYRYNRSARFGNLDGNRVDDLLFGGVFSPNLPAGSRYRIYSRNNGITHFFNERGHVIAIIYNYRNDIGFSYSGNSISQITDSLGNEVTFSHYSDSMSITLPDESVISLSFYGVGVTRQLVSKTDPIGNVTSFEYETVTTMFDAFSERSMSNYPFPQTFAAPVYHDSILLKSIAYPSGAITRYEYTTRIRSIQSHHWRVAFTPEGQLVTINYRSYGSREIAAVASRYELVSNVEHNRMDYTYSPLPRLTDSGLLHFYYATTTTDKGLSTNYLFERRIHQLVEKTVSYNGEDKTKKTLEHNNTHLLPSSSVRRVRNDYSRTL